MEYLEEDVLDDVSQYKNYGMVITDYKINFATKTLVPGKGTNLSKINIDEENKAY